MQALGEGYAMVPVVRAMLTRIRDKMRESGQARFVTSDGRAMRCLGIALRVELAARSRAGDAG
jgi:hypothetical protein